MRPEDLADEVEEFLKFVTYTPEGERAYLGPAKARVYLAAFRRKQAA